MPKNGNHASKDAFRQAARAVKGHPYPHQTRRAHLPPPTASDGLRRLVVLAGGGFEQGACDSALFYSYQISI